MNKISYSKFLKSILLLFLLLSVFSCKKDRFKKNDLFSANFNGIYYRLGQPNNYSISYQLTKVFSSESEITFYYIENSTLEIDNKEVKGDIYFGGVNYGVIDYTKKLVGKISKKNGNFIIEGSFTSYYSDIYQTEAPYELTGTFTITPD